MGDTYQPQAPEPKDSIQTSSEVTKEGKSTPENQGARQEETLGEGGLKALKAERDARAEAEKRAKAIEDKLKEYEQKEKEAEEAQLSELERERKRALEAQESLAKAQADMHRFQALAKYPVPEEYQDLVRGDSADALMESAKKIHELHAKTIEQNEQKKPFDYSMPGSGKTPPVKGGSFEAAAERARAKYNK